MRLIENLGDFLGSRKAEAATAVPPPHLGIRACKVGDKQVDDQDGGEALIHLAGEQRKPCRVGQGAAWQSRAAGHTLGSTMIPLG